MKWETVDGVTIRSGKFIICKTQVADVWRYTLWSGVLGVAEKSVLYQTYDSAKACKAHAARLVVPVPSGDADAGVGRAAGAVVGA